MKAPTENRPTRVLVVLTSNARRGAEIEGLRLATELRAQGVEATAIALAPAVGSSTLAVDVLGTKPISLSTLQALRTRGRKADVVIAYGSSALPACALALGGTGVPFVYRSIGDPTAWVRGGLHQKRTRLLMRRSAHIVVLWPDAATAIQSLYSIEARRVSVIPNARSPEEFRPATSSERAKARATLCLPADASVIGCVGAIAPEKRVSLTAEVVSELPNAHLLVVGDGPEREPVETYARGVLGERAHFTGILRDVTVAYAAMDLLLMTSSTEGLPGVMVEASMSAIPTVAADVGGTRWLRDSGARITVYPLHLPAPEIAELCTAALLGVDRSTPSIPRYCSWSEVTPAWIDVLSSILPAKRADRN